MRFADELQNYKREGAHDDQIDAVKYALMSLTRKPTFREKTMKFLKKIAAPFVAALAVVFCLLMLVAIAVAYPFGGDKAADGMAKWAGKVVSRMAAWLDN